MGGVDCNVIMEGGGAYYALAEQAAPSDDEGAFPNLPPTFAEIITDSVYSPTLANLKRTKSAEASAADLFPQSIT